MNREITNAFNNNKNSVITIIKEVLGKEAQEHIVKKLSYQIMEHYSRSEQKLDKSLENDNFIMDLTKQIFESVKSNTSLTELLAKSEKERESLLVELEKIKKEHSNSQDVDFTKMIEEAEVALNEYDSERYRAVLEAYRENERHKEIVKNIATTHYLSAKSFANDFMYEKAEKEISKAIVLDNENRKYSGFNDLILLNLGKYSKVLEKNKTLWKRHTERDEFIVYEAKSLRIPK